jgi:hypothetical protein
MRNLGRAAVAIVLALTGLGSGDLAGQAILDEGTFRLSRDGREIGTETFTIRQTGSGAEAVVIAQGRTVYREGPEREVITGLQVTGGTLRPSAYDVSVSGDEEQKIGGRVVGTRFSARVVASGGERMREYLVSEGAVVAEQGIAHHHYFIAQRFAAGASRMPVLVPLQGRQVWVTVTSTQETVQVGGESVGAQRLTISVEGGDERRVWVDSQGRVLRLEIPASRLVADRIALPG